MVNLFTASLLKNEIDIIIDKIAHSLISRFAQKENFIGINFIMNNYPMIKIEWDLIMYGTRKIIDYYFPSFSVDTINGIMSKI